MNAKTLFSGAALLLMMASCSHAFTPERAANTGGKKCNKRNRITWNENKTAPGGFIASVDTTDNDLSSSAPVFAFGK